MYVKYVVSPRCQLQCQLNGRECRRYAEAMTAAVAACACIAIGHYANRILSDGSACGRCASCGLATLALRPPLALPA